MRFWDPNATQFRGERITRTPEAILAAADEELPSGAARIYVLFSGGNDSAVLLHYMHKTLGYSIDAAVFIDTGTAVPGVREHVEAVCRSYGVPLLVFESRDAFRRLVLEAGGFPGPAGHGRAYTRLKERQIEKLVRTGKRKRTDRIVLLTGKRRAESSRRSVTTAGVERKGATVWVNPLADWDARMMWEYRAEHGLAESDVAALIHRSGECNCGAFAQPGEREMLQSLWPEWFEQTIASLEREAAAAGVPACRWGERPPKPGAPAAGHMCSSCVLEEQ